MGECKLIREMAQDLPFKLAFTIINYGVKTRRREMHFMQVFKEAELILNNGF